MISGFYIEKQEATEILICVLAISLALAIALGGGIHVFFNLYNLIFILSFFVVTVGAGFILHEMAHKLVAIYYGAYARFQMWSMGLLLMFILVFLTGIVFAAPGAVYIYSPMITRRQNGIISVAGPITNLLLVGIFIALGFFAPVYFPITIFKGNAWFFGAYINAMLAFLNMLPIPPLDGSKVLAWNPVVWIAVTGIAFAIFLLG